MTDTIEMTEPPLRSHAENLALDRKLAETARMVRDLAMQLDEPDIAQHADLLERQARELITQDQLRLAGYFEGGGVAQPGHSVRQLGGFS